MSRNPSNSTPLQVVTQSACAAEFKAYTFTTLIMKGDSAPSLPLSVPAHADLTRSYSRQQEADEAAAGYLRLPCVFGAGLGVVLVHTHKRHPVCSASDATTRCRVGVPTAANVCWLDKSAIENKSS